MNKVREVKSIYAQKLKKNDIYDKKPFFTKIMKKLDKKGFKSHI